MEKQIVHSFKRSETEQVSLALREFKGKPYVDLRIYFKPRGSDEFMPSKKGITLSTEFIPQLKAAFEKAEEALAARV